MLDRLIIAIYVSGARSPRLTKHLDATLGRYACHRDDDDSYVGTVHEAGDGYLGIERTMHSYAVGVANSHRTTSQRNLSMSR